MFVALLVVYTRSHQTNFGQCLDVTIFESMFDFMWKRQFPFQQGPSTHYRLDSGHTRSHSHFVGHTRSHTLSVTHDHTVTLSVTDYHAVTYTGKDTGRAPKLWEARWPLRYCICCWSCCPCSRSLTYDGRGKVSWLLDVDLHVPATMPQRRAH